MIFYLQKDNVLLDFHLNTYRYFFCCIKHNNEVLLESRIF